MSQKPTKRLYWDTPMESEFTASIVGLAERDGKLGVILDQTLFHPLGGGQPWDTGVLTIHDGKPVSVFGTKKLVVSGAIEEDGAVIHLVEGVPASVLRSAQVPEGDWKVSGRIDWDRRFDIMQQHTGQHILSRAFEVECGAKTVGFHLADTYVSIDLDIADAKAEDIARAEDAANRVVFSDVPVEVKEYSKDDLPGNVRGRFEIASDTIRVVCVGEYDACPCAGTHLASSGQAGLIKINEIDRAHGGLRVVFRCGGRALSDYRQKQSLLDETARVLSQKIDAVPETVRAMNEKLAALQELYDVSQESLLEFEIESVLGGGNEERKCLVLELSGQSADKLKYAAKKIAEKSGKLTVCYAAEPRFSAAIVSLAEGGPDARQVAAAIAERWGGRGGGSREVAQLGSKEPLAAHNEAVVKSVSAICESFMDP